MKLVIESINVIIARKLFCTLINILTRLPSELLCERVSKYQHAPPAQVEISNVQYACTRDINSVSNIR